MKIKYDLSEKLLLKKISKHPQWISQNNIDRKTFYKCTYNNGDLLLEIVSYAGSLWTYITKDDPSIIFDLLRNAEIDPNKCYDYGRGLVLLQWKTGKIVRDLANPNELYEIVTAYRDYDSQFGCESLVLKDLRTGKEIKDFQRPHAIEFLSNDDILKELLLISLAKKEGK